MILRKNGIALKLATKDKKWWAKLVIALILSNILFFLFFQDNEVQADIISPPGKVEIRIRADLFTPFSQGKKILIINQGMSISRPGIFLAEHPEEDHPSYTVQIDEEYVDELLNTNHLQIIPFVKHIKLKKTLKKYNYEIRY